MNKESAQYAIESIGSLTEHVQPLDQDAKRNYAAALVLEGASIQSLRLREHYAENNRRIVTDFVTQLPTPESYAHFGMARLRVARVAEYARGIRSTEKINLKEYSRDYVLDDGTVVAALGQSTLWVRQARVEHFAAMVDMDGGVHYGCGRLEYNPLFIVGFNADKARVLLARGPMSALPKSCNPRNGRVKYLPDNDHLDPKIYELALSKKVSNILRHRLSQGIPALSAPDARAAFDPRDQNFHVSVKSPGAIAADGKELLPTNVTDEDLITYNVLENLENLARFFDKTKALKSALESIRDA